MNKKEIYKLNGFIYLKGFKNYPWLTETYNSRGEQISFFLLNAITKQQFKKDILPIIRRGDVNIPQELYEEIRGFKQNPPIEEQRREKCKLVIPEGITLKEHQDVAVHKMMQYNKYSFFLGTGTGKTLIAITWLLSKKPDSCLIVTPQKVVGQYKSEIDKYIPGNNYEVTNYEQLPKYVSTKYQALILDESHRAKNYSSNINENCRKIAENCEYVYLFTGTPQDKSRHDILAQLAILDSRVMPGKSHTLERYFEFNDYFQPSKEKPEFSEELTAIINCYTWGKATEDVVDLTKEHNIIVKCPHPTEWYDELKNKRVVIDSKWNTYCVADNKGVLRIRLREICTGILTTQDDKYVQGYTEVTSPKINKFRELIQTLPKAIIYYEFTSSLNQIEQVLKDGGKKYVVVNGRCNTKKSTILIERFKYYKEIYLVIQCRSGNAGLDLTNTNNIIFYSLPESYIVFHQCKARIRRIGQLKECYYYYLICADTVEEHIYSTLKRKKSFTDKVFQNYLNE